MEVPGPAVDLSQYVENNKGPLQESQAKLIIKQLVDAAKRREDNNIFHRDMKPHNILITDSEVPQLQLTDFGLSCFTNQAHDNDGFYGTEEHAPAEWLSNGVYNAGPATVWQVGVATSQLRAASASPLDFIKHKTPLRVWIRHRQHMALLATPSGSMELLQKYMKMDQGIYFLTEDSRKNGPNYLLSLPMAHR
uniref:non-specific serine/threonine protein kinase n=1 Tax=Nothobranchius furzeri TaxID=105023 RepID=A0A8C6M316_NOTFU